MRGYGSVNKRTASYLYLFSKPAVLRILTWVQYGILVFTNRRVGDNNSMQLLHPPGQTFRFGMSEGRMLA